MGYVRLFVVNLLNSYFCGKYVSVIAHCLYIAHSEGKGRGVFTTKDISKGSVIEIAPVLVMSAAERILIDKTLLHDYIFEWGDNSDQCCMALGWIAVYNHSYQSNCEYDMDYDEKTITIKTVRKVKAGEELFINYSGSWNATKPVWFDAS